MTGRLLEALRVVPPALWRHLGAQFGIEPPELVSLRTMYPRRRMLFEHQDLACAVLGFHALTEAQRRALVRAINAELSRISDRQWLLPDRSALSHEPALLRSDRSPRRPGRLADRLRRLPPKPVSSCLPTIFSDGYGAVHAVTACRAAANT